MLLQDRPRGYGIQFAIEGNDAAEGRGGVGAVGVCVGFGDALGARDAAGVGMLDDYAGGGIELPHAFERGVAVGDIVVREFLALELLRLRHAGADGARIGVERGLLMRILAVAQIQMLAKRQIQVIRKGRRRAADGAGEVRRYHGVVLSGVRECLGGEPASHGVVGRALIGRQFVEQRAVVARIDHDRDRGMVLGGGAHHGRSADVDVIDRIIVSGAGACHRGGERIEIDGQQIDGLYRVLAHDGFVDAAPSQKAAVNLRMQRLDPAAHDLRKAGVLGHFFDDDAVIRQQLGGAAGRQQLDAAFAQFAGEFNDAGLVGNAEQRTADGREQWRAYSLRPNSLSFLRKVPRLMPRMVAARL